VKEKKPIAAEIMAFYTGGAKLHAVTSHTKEELEGMMEGGIEGGKKCVRLDTVNEDNSILDDSLTLLFDKLLFYTILVKNNSPIISLDKKIEVVGGNNTGTS
jgi:hypothetical protein